MKLKRVLAFGGAAVMLAIGWLPVAFIVDGGRDYARARLASIVDRAVEGGPALPAFRVVDAAVFLDPRQIPAAAVARPGPVAAGSAPDTRGPRVEAARRSRTAGSSHPPPAAPERPYAHLVRRAAERHGVDPRLVHAVIEVESSYRASVVSVAGAMGLMQLMPVTAQRYGVSDPLDPEANIEAGTRYLRALLDEFGPLFQLDALAAYHAGEPVVRRHGGIPPYPQTHRFVRRVLEVLLSQTGRGGAD